MLVPNYENVFSKDINFADKKVNIKIGKFSEQSTMAILATCGETVVHTTIVMGRVSSLPYFPLQVEYIEKLYAGGIIKGSRWVKREGRSSDDAVLKARVIDRSIRPLFPEGLQNEIQVVNTVFSYDSENDPDMLALLASCLALEISKIPFYGPIAGLRIGFNQDTNEYLINPTNEQRENSQLDLVVSGNKEAIVMVEAGAKEVSEDVVLKGLEKAQKVLDEICQQFLEIKEKIGQEKVVFNESPDAKSKLEKKNWLMNEIANKYADKIKEYVKLEANLEPLDIDDFALDLSEEFTSEETTIEAGLVKGVLFELMKKEARRMILEEGERPDGRKTDEIRPIWCEVDIFPRTHGSAMFKRGATQACTITTLASPSLGQYIEDIEGQEVRHYIHHYNMPPYASGEAGNFSYPKRREIGHGSLAERALLPVIPPQEEFPYTIRVVSEILSSNGSTSQASVCGSTMSLMAAGVPIKKPISGIAMGLISDGKSYIVLSDIQGLEDHVGDMDFKVAGSKDGITALQMDIKLTGIPFVVLKHALEQARNGRIFILNKMLECIHEPRKTISKYAPKIEQLTIPADRIGELIGPGGKIIKALIEKTGAEIDIEEDNENKIGLVNISSPDQEKITLAKKTIEDMFREIHIGEEFNGTVTRIEDYGAFVEFLPSKEGLVHVSRMAIDYVDDPRKLVSLGDTVHVRISNIKDDGKIELSMISSEQEATLKKQRGGGEGGRTGGRNRSGRNFSPRGRNFSPRQTGSRSFTKNRESGFKSSI